MNSSTSAAAHSPANDAHARPSAAPPVFHADKADGPDAFGGHAGLGHAAELIAHADVETPLTFGVFGPAGAGKSHAAQYLTARARALTSAAAALGAKSPFLARLAVVRLSAPCIVEDASGGVASAIFDKLTNPASGLGFAALARGAAQASRDPHIAVRQANARLNETRKQLDGEQLSLEDLDGRRARLADALLYDSAGSRIDVHARANRAMLERRLSSFGFSGDPIATYKDLVRDAAEREGLSGKMAAFLRSLWAFGGQARLIVWAIVFFLIAWGLGLARDTSATWLPWLAGLSEQTKPAVDLLGERLPWLNLLRQGALVVAALCLLTNLWRAMRFLGPLTRGAQLLRSELDTRRRDLDAQIAHKTRHVDALAQEADALGRAAMEAERRAGEVDQAGGAAANTHLFPEADGENHARRARTFVEALEKAIAQSPGAPNAPQRIVVVLDDLDGLAPARAAGLFEDVHRLVARPGFALVACADPAHLAGGWAGAADAAQKLQRLVQIPLSIAGRAGDDALRLYAGTLLSGASRAAPRPVDAGRSALDEPLDANEAGLIAALAPLAGATPRAVKRFVNIHRLARARGGDLTALALMLALDGGGAAGELNAMGAAMDAEQPERELAIHPGEARLAAALAAVNAARGKALTIGEAQAAWAAASDYRAPL